MYCTGSGPCVDLDQSDPSSPGRAEEAGPGGAQTVGSEDGGSTTGLLLPPAPRPGDSQHSAHKHGQNTTLHRNKGGVISLKQSKDVTTFLRFQDSFVSFMTDSCNFSSQHFKFH